MLTTMKNQLMVAGIAVGVLAASNAARATTITQSWNIPTVGTPITINEPYNLFNSNLGTLNSVTIQLILDGTADIQVFNSTGAPQTFTNASTSVPLSVTGPPTVTTYISSTITASIPSGSVTSAPFTDFPGVAATFNSGLVGVPIIDWGSFAAFGGGASLFPLTFFGGAATSSITSVSGIGAGGSATVGDASSFLYLVYNYTPAVVTGVPEPGTWALLAASGCVSLMGIRRRRTVK